MVMINLNTSQGVRAEENSSSSGRSRAKVVSMYNGKGFGRHGDFSRTLQEDLEFLIHPDERNPQSQFLCFFYQDLTEAATKRLIKQPHEAGWAKFTYKDPDSFE